MHKHPSTSLKQSQILSTSNRGIFFDANRFIQRYHEIHNQWALMTIPQASQPARPTTEQANGWGCIHLNLAVHVYIYMWILSCVLQASGPLVKHWLSPYWSGIHDFYLFPSTPMQYKYCIGAGGVKYTYAPMYIYVFACTLHMYSAHIPAAIGLKCGVTKNN